MKSRVKLFLIVFLAGVLFVSCENDSDGPGENEVVIENYAFHPETITIKKGTTITWINKDDVDHTVTSNDGLFDSGNIGPGETYERTFDTPGTYNYYCTIHPQMTGTVIVN